MYFMKLIILNLDVVKVASPCVEKKTWRTILRDKVACLCDILHFNVISRCSLKYLRISSSLKVHRSSISYKRQVLGRLIKISELFIFHSVMR